MKKMFFVAALVCALFSHKAHSQSLFGKVKNAAKQTTEEVVADKTREKTRQALDSALTAKKNNKKGKTSPETEEAALPETEVANGTPIAVQQNPIQQDALKSYAKFDFVPGETLVYYNDFANESLGELPVDWNTSGAGQVVTFNNVPGKWMKMLQSSSFLTDNKATFGENFTVEFDIIFGGQENNIIYYPALYFGFLSTGNQPTDHSSFLESQEKYFSFRTYLGVIADGNGNSISQIESNVDWSQYFQTQVKTLPNMEQMITRPIHVSIQVQKTRLRLWLNEDKVYDVPKAITHIHPINQLFFQLSETGLSDDLLGVYISNLRVADGVPDLRKLFDKGSFSTSAIQFDTNKANIKPESYGYLNLLGAFLKQDESIRVEITGHTDSVGSDAENQTLSEKRAEAIKTYLTNEHQIAAGRMKTSGKGEKAPIDTNDTNEGRARNRRVEFIKL